MISQNCVSHLQKQQIDNNGTVKLSLFRSRIIITDNNRYLIQITDRLFGLTDSIQLPFLKKNWIGGSQILPQGITLNR